LREEPHPLRPTLLHALLQQTHRRYLTSNPLPSNSEQSCKETRGGPKTERLIGNEVWRTRDASPPHTVHAAPRGRSRKQVANRRLPSGSPSLGLPELKKSIYTPNFLHPTLGLTEVRVWFERRRPVLSPSMAS
jgi:hypothetical protein